ncbi:MAG: DUF456 family protein [Pirellulales bacterium]
MIYVWITLLVLALLTGWVLTIFSLPGNWLMVVAVGLFAWFVPADSRAAISWKWVAALVVLALLGEIAELLAAALGAAKGGGSKRGTVLAVIGSVVGSLGLALVGLPIPVVGPVVAAVLGAALGALGGAMLGEHWKGRTLNESWKVGQGAFWGRLLGTLAKVSIGTAMLVVGIMAMIL